MNYLDPYNFYFELPIYSPIEITPQKLDDFRKLVNFSGKIDGYNPDLKEQTTYNVSINRRYAVGDANPTYYDKTTTAYLRCLRSDKTF